MDIYKYNMEKAKLCESAEFVFRGDADLAKFYHNAKIGFLKRAQKALHK